MSIKESANLATQQELNRIAINIQQLTGALSQNPVNHPNMQFLLVFLGSSHEERFDLRGETDDIDKAIEYTSIVLTLIPDDDEMFSALLSDLGARHRKRFKRLGTAEDNDKSIEYSLLAVSFTPEGHPELPGMLGNVATFHCDRFARLGELNDLEKAIEYESRALALTPEGHPGLSSRLANLGTAYIHRFQCRGEIIDIEKAVEYQSRAVALIPDDHPDLALYLGNLGVSYYTRSERLGEPSNVETAIQCMSRAVELTPDGHPYLPSRLGNLGASYRSRFEQLGEFSDLEESIKYQFRAVELTPDGHPGLPSLLANLAGSQSDRFKYLGDLDDIEKAIKYEYRAVELTPVGHPDLSYHLASLGASLIARFERLGELEDLEKAIKNMCHAVELTPETDPNLSLRLTNLGASHNHRFHRLRQLEDLDKAIKLDLRALASTPDSHPDLPVRLTNLGVSYTDRFECLQELDDLEKSIEYKCRALSLTPIGHPALSERLHNLGVSYDYRFRYLNEREDLEKVIECMACALELTPDGHQNLPHSHFALAKSLLHHYTLNGGESHLQGALDSYRSATQSLAGSPRAKFSYAVLWAKQASKHSFLNCIEAYQTAIELLPQFIWLGATTTQRYQDLEEARDLAASAAYTAILSSKNALALEFLEHTRCVVWSQNLMLRSPLDRLRSLHPALATRLQTVANQLHRAGSESREFQARSSNSLSPEQVAQQHRQLAREYTSLIAEARPLRGFEDFLRPMKAQELALVARKGPVVVINCHEERCDALVIIPGRDHIDHIPLPNFTGKQAQFTRLEMHRSVRNSRMRERGVERRPVVEDRVEFENVLATLWYDVVKPVLDFLGYTSNRSNVNMPHITWCPTGALSFLPLHAAGDYNQPQSRTFNYAISSYTPTLTALLSSTPSPLTFNSRLLAIGQPNTPGHSSLPSTTKELAFLKGHTSGKVEYSQLTDKQATKMAVLDAMEQHDWVHLACHAHQNVQDPTQSGFFLYDDTLDLASINRRSFKKKGLAYLSACQTATGDGKLPDEAIHLASGMLMAGYSSVIATMWSVMDDDAPFVADKVYSQLMRDGTLGDGEAGKALHYAVQELREKVGEREFTRWIPYIHIGS
ncbi:hypothetical protein OPQ81_005158 [Rhizoctonia solani]|nr:hypothetical protein OPQ81_005158 [Rhizoctonia solani]